jgi:hypothetical protein
VSNNSEYTKNHNVEFETLSENSKTPSSVIGKRKDHNNINTMRSETIVKTESDLDS